LGEKDFRGKSKGGGKGKERGKSRGGEKRLYAKDASCYNSIRLCLRSVQTTCVSNQRARDVIRRGALSYSDISGHVCGLNTPSLPPSLPRDCMRMRLTARRGVPCWRGVPLLH